MVVVNCPFASIVAFVGIIWSFILRVIFVPLRVV